jgi:uncharacterized repeat protein (TIGR01451 family)
MKDQGGDDTKDSDFDPTTGLSQTVVIDALGTGIAKDNLTVDGALYSPKGSIGDYVWKDTDNDGIQDAGEPAVAGVIVQLLNTSGTVVATDTTNASGLYLFSNLSSGSYQVKIVTSSLPAGCILSTMKDQGGDDTKDSDFDPATGLSQTVVIDALGTGIAKDNLTIDGALYSPKGSIGDYVWKDTDNDGIQDAGEPAVAGVIVQLLNTSGMVVATDTTDASGLYNFPNLSSGSYQVKIVTSSLPAGCILSTMKDQGGDDTKDSDFDPATGLSQTVVIDALGTGTAKDNPTIDAGLYTPKFDLALKKMLAVGQSASVTPSSTVKFTITLYNQGDINASNIQVSDYIPTGLTLNDANWSVSNGIATLNTPIASLAAGASTTRDISFTVNAGFTGSATNVAEISSAKDANGNTPTDVDSTPDNNPNNDGTPKNDVINENGKNGGDEDDSDPEVITVTPTPVFDLALRKTLASGQSTTINPGSTVKFTVTIFNQGNVDATAIQVSDYIPSGLTLNDANWTVTGSTATLKTPIASLAAGSSTTVDISFTVNAGVTGSLTNMAEISSATGGTDVDSTPDNNPNNDGTPKNDVINEDGKKGGDEDDSDPEVITVTPTPVFDLALKKTLASGQAASVNPGSTVKFTITVYNQGNVDATAIQVSDYIPAGLTLSDANWTVTGSTATLKTPIASLAAGSSTTVDISFTVNASFTGSATNVAEISSATGGTDVDSTPDNNPNNDGTPKNDVINENGKTGGDEDDSDPEVITVTPTPVFDLALRKTLASGQSATINPGSSVKFTITVYNQGNVDATAIQVSDYIPTGLTLNDANWSVSNGIATLKTAIASLAAGASTTRDITFTVNAGVTGSLTNMAEISSAKDANGNTPTDVDSTPDNNPNNDGTPKNDVINENGKTGGDEDDSDPEVITILCVKPILTTGNIVCSGTTYSVVYYSSVTNVTASAGTVANGMVSGIPVGTNVTITATQSTGCVSTLTVQGPASCQANPNCIMPSLIVGQPACEGNNTYTVSFYADHGTVTVSAGTISGNSVINIPIGQDLTIRATDGTCVSTSVVPRPSNCSDPCENPSVSLSGPVCDSVTAYHLNYVLSPGATLVSSHGTVSNGQITGLPTGTSVTLTVKKSGCADKVVIFPPVYCSSSKVDLHLRKLISKKQAKIGDVIDYTIKVWNESSTFATGVEVTDALNAGVQYVSSSTTRGSYDGSTGRWTIGSIGANGDTVTLTIQVKVLSQGIWFNTAEITRTNEPDQDSTPGNGTDSEDDIDRQCFTVPIGLCTGEKVQITVPAQYTGVKWYKNGVEITSLQGQNVVLLSEAGTYTYSSTSNACPAEGCCPLLIEASANCCPVQVCIPLTLKKVRK